MEKYSKSFLVKFALVVMILTAIITIVITTLFYGAISLSGDGNQIAQYKKIQELVKDHYLYDYDKNTMFNGACYGMIATLEDPYSTYLSSEDLQAVEEQTKGEFLGIGVEVMVDPEDMVTTVASVIEDSPAFQAGIQTGDKVLKINDESIIGEKLTDVVKRLKDGPKKEKLKITVQRGGETMDIEVMRDVVHTITVKDRMLSDTIGYLRITSFNSNTYDEFKKALKKVEKEGAVSLVLDLRNNPGGTVAETEKIADLFLDEGTIYYTQDKHGNKKYAYSKDGMDDIPLIILVNGSSASASELLSGSLKDNGRAKLVGTQTFGKGIMQEFFGVSMNSALKLTTRKYYTPGGEEIHGFGITPDIVVEQDEAVTLGDPEQDVQLKRAIEEFSK